MTYQKTLPTGKITIHTAGNRRMVKSHDLWEHARTYLAQHENKVDGHPYDPKGVGSIYPF